MKKTLTLVSVLLLSACATANHPTPHTTSNGTQGYKITCSEFNTTFEQCKAQASNLCSNGAEVDKNLTFKEVYPDAGDGMYMPSRNHVVVGCVDTKGSKS